MHCITLYTKNLQLKIKARTNTLDRTANETPPQRSIDKYYLRK